MQATTIHVLIKQFIHSFIYSGESLYHSLDYHIIIERTPPACIDVTMYVIKVLYNNVYTCSCTCITMLPKCCQRNTQINFLFTKKENNCKILHNPDSDSL